MKNLENLSLSNAGKRFLIEVIFIVFFFILAFTGRAFSQDVIVKRDNSEIKAKVIEIQENSIKYKPFDFLEGPLRSVPTSDVLKIIYENGRIENFVMVEKEVSPAENSSSDNQVSTKKNSNYYPLRIFGRVGVQFWINEDLSDFFGNNPLFGAGIEKQLFSDLKIGADIDFISKTKDEVTLNYTQFGVSAKYSWYAFGSDRPNICGGFGVKGVSLKDIEDNYSWKGISVGFSALAEIELPLGKKIILNLGLTTIWGKIPFEEEKINIGSNIFYGGLIFNLW